MGARGGIVGAADACPVEYQTTAERRPDALQLSDAIARFTDEAAGGYAVMYASTALGGYADDTVEGYKAALRGLSVTLRMQPGASARACLDDHLLGIVRTARSAAGLKKVLSGVRVLEHFKWIPPIVVAMDWRLVESAEKFRAKQYGGAQKFWASIQSLRSLCALCHTPADWELAALGALSAAFGLRAKVAVGVRYDGINVRWTGAKGRAGECTEAPGPWARVWGEFLSELRARNGFHPERPAWHTSRQAIHTHLRELVSRPGSGCALLRWHAWRRYGAAQLRLLGATTPTLLRWGGWAATAMLRIYA